MSKIIREIGAGLGILIFIINLTGCAAVIGAVAGGAGTALWLSVKLSDEVNASYQETVKATKAALTSLEMPINKETRTDEVTQIISKYIDGRDVWIDIRPLSERSSKIEIRVGVKGDKSASQEILERIKSFL